MKTTQKVAPLAATLITFGSLAGGANAAITVQVEIIDSGHILNGATIVSTTADADTWNSFGSRVFAGSATTVTISGATGAGANWNGVYSFLAASLPNFENVGFGGTAIVEGGALYGPTAYSSDGNNHRGGFGDGAGNNFVFRAGIVEGSVAPEAGNSVVSENFNSSITTWFNFASTGGTNTQWTQPSGFTASITVGPVPEPSSVLLLGLGAIGAVTRRRRS